MEFLINLIYFFIDAFSYWFMIVWRLINRPDPVQQLKQGMLEAKSYEAWALKAAELDFFLGNDVWRESPASRFYDYKYIYQKLQHLKRVRENNDVDAMLYLLRSGLIRNLAGLGNPRLYSRSYLGTKNLIEEYLCTVVDAFEYIADNNFPDLSRQSKLNFFSDARQCFGRSALLLYGGSSFGLFHLGVAKSLNENGLLPRIICGSGVGNLMAALICTCTDEELINLFKPNGINLGAFAKAPLQGTVWRKIHQLLRHGYFMDIRVLEEYVRSNVGDITFEEAYKRTKRILNITVFSSRRYEVPQLLNYLSAPNVLIRSAACASVAMFGLYDQIDLLAKDRKGNIISWGSVKWRKWSDTTSVEGESVLARISELYNVNHFILSQGNPFVAPFLPKGLYHWGDTLWFRFGIVFMAEIHHRLTQLDKLGIIPKSLRGLVDERVSGDITIVPQIFLSDFGKLLSNPTRALVDHWIERGESSTWPHLSLIRARCLIELALDRIYLRLKNSGQGAGSRMYGRENISIVKRHKSMH
ncbi:uncharacterized protein VTP21DRAFT_1211 [Calcarisporiella thermophila]|uniref:uncharacterized protein n=1 Tax=Calcarisporiella thermophila TaxID=911321 RepID=UPI003742E032